MEAALFGTARLATYTVARLPRGYLGGDVHSRAVHGHGIFVFLARIELRRIFGIFERPLKNLILQRGNTKSQLHILRVTVGKNDAFIAFAGFHRQQADILHRTRTGYDPTAGNEIIRADSMLAGNVHADIRKAGSFKAGARLYRDIQLHQLVSKDKFYTRVLAALARHKGATHQVNGFLGSLRADINGVRSLVRPRFR